MLENVIVYWFNCGCSYANHIEQFFPLQKTLIPDIFLPLMSLEQTFLHNPQLWYPTALIGHGVAFGIDWASHVTTYLKEAGLLMLVVLFL